jgi:hypothetical protein
MERYDYLKAMTADIMEYIKSEYTNDEIRTNLDDRNNWEETLHDVLWIEDCVTGNASGSYTFNRYAAEEYICHNLELLGEALTEFGDDSNALQKGAEWCDVTIRCYLLGQAIYDALNALEEEYAE